jgi:polysaccharide export outer membrane protein
MIQSGTDPKAGPPKYVLVNVNQDVLNAMQRTEATDSLHFANPGGSDAPGANVAITGPDVQKIRVGDVLGVSIYTSGGGLFGTEVPPTEGTVSSSTSQNSETVLPPQLVDSSGKITVPHAGRIDAVGHTPSEVENEINDALKGQAIMPSVIVTIQDRKGGSDLVTLSGDVKNPSRVTVPLAGLRILDAIAAAGGITGKDYNTEVTVLRGKGVHTYLYRDITTDPNKNTYLQDGDTILVQTKDRTYTTLGAQGQNLHLFDSETLSASEALASVGGMNDEQANPEAVFIYRFESPLAVKGLGMKPDPITGSGVPVIYELDLRQPVGFFIAKQFAIRDKDVIFVGNAGSIGVIKAMRIIGALTSPAVSGLSAGSGVSALSH